MNKLPLIPVAIVLVDAGFGASGHGYRDFNQYTLGCEVVSIKLTPRKAEPLWKETMLKELTRDNTDETIGNVTTVTTDRAGTNTNTYVSTQRLIRA